MEGKEGLVRAYRRARDRHGMLSLSLDKQVGLWSRVAGDGLDIATLLRRCSPDNPKRDNVELALAMVLGVTLLDILGAQGTTVRHSRKGGGDAAPVHGTGAAFRRAWRAARGAARDFRTPPDMRARAGDRLKEG